MIARAWLLWGTGGGVLVLVLAALWAIPFDLASERVQQAALAAIVVAAGWFLGFMLREVSQLLDRAERLRDAHRALFAEIQHNVTNLGSRAALAEDGYAMLDRILGTDGFVPFIPRERNDTVFAALVADIHILPRVTIDPVVQYYSQLAALDALIDDMRGESFKTMSPQRRHDLYRDYINLKFSALDYGEAALAAIDAYSKKGAPAAAAALRRHREARDAKATASRDGA